MAAEALTLVLNSHGGCRVEWARQGNVLSLLDLLRYFFLFTCDCRGPLHFEGSNEVLHAATTVTYSERSQISSTLDVRPRLTVFRSQIAAPTCGSLRHEYP